MTKLTNTTSTGRGIPNGPTFPPGVPVEVDDELAASLLQQDDVFVSSGSSSSTPEPEPKKAPAKKAPAKKRAPKKARGAKASTPAPQDAGAPGSDEE